jgi:hypothetical protein
MQASELADKAEAFLAGINGLDRRLQARQISVERKLGPFHSEFRFVGPKATGAYWLFRPDGEVFYIGKAVDCELWARVTSHHGGAKWQGDENADYEQTVGEGWGFPNYRKVRREGVDPVTREAILKGDFYAGWIAVEPPMVGAVVEAYLQALCFAVDGRLPEFCDRQG